MRVRIPSGRSSRSSGRSIAAFGFTNPVLADEAGNIIARHGRLRAAREMGPAEVPMIELARLSEAQKKALRLADNKIALNAGWDLEILKLELADLSLPKGRHREFAMAAGEMSTTEFRTFLGQSLGACASVSRDGAVHFVCMDWRHMDDECRDGGQKYGDVR